METQLNYPWARFTGYFPDESQLTEMDDVGSGKGFKLRYVFSGKRVGNEGFKIFWDFFPQCAYVGFCLAHKVHEATTITGSKMKKTDFIG